MKMKQGRNDLLQGTLDMLVLKTLAIGAQHGYGIARRILATSNEALRVEEGSLYPALHRMEKRGWIKSECGLSESNRKAKFYRLTAKGKKQLVEQQASWERMTKAVSQVLRATAEAGQ